MTDNTKYPSNIQKLFAPRPPLPYIQSTDYPSESRKTNGISPLSSISNQLKAYLQELPAVEHQNQRPAPTEQQVKLKLSQQRKKQQAQSFARQVQEWNDPELLQKNEKEFMKDPYRTVFLSRLDYAITELELTKHFNKYGGIESVRVIRDRNGKSRGYAFLVYEKEQDAAACVNELARSGLKLPVGDKTPTRSILVDIERGRIIRSWKPRRLGGGLGGRHYTKPDVRGPNTASAAASGRRIHIANNPQFPAPSYRPPPKPQSYGYSGLASAPSTEEKSVRDKYAKYSSTSSYESTAARRTDGGARSIRNIRGN